VWNQKVLNETVAALDKERFRVYVHVIGNAAANEAILDAFEFARTANLAWDARHAITHVNNGAAPAAARYRALGVRADGHPVPRAFFDLGVASSSSSDYPVRDFFPFVRIATGVGNGVPRDAMIASHTIAGAELMFAEREIGSLETGKSTDLVVLDRNLLDTPAAEIERARVLLTLFAGKEVFRDPSLD
jgi:predicted amidohydrolase YtcJ